jgi:hypothetical protein
MKHIPSKISPRSTACRIVVLSALSLSLVYGAQGQDFQLPPGVTVTKTPTLVSTNDLPAVGTFWLAYGEDGQQLPPFPFLPPGGGDVYDIGNGNYLIDNSETVATPGRMSAMESGVPTPPGDGSGGGVPMTSSIPGRMEITFQNIAFSLLSDTNDVSLGNPTLYNILTNFPADTNIGPNLQIVAYGTNSVVIKANQFDYSSDTMDFGLIISDDLSLPVWKNVDLLCSSDAQDGWVLAGTVANWQVTAPMYILVQNLPTNDNAFFEAIPYAGAQVTLSGPAPNSTVSDVITLTASIQDLSGTSNEMFSMNVDGAPARFTIGAGNTISFDTKYNINGSDNIYASVVCTNAQVYNPTNMPDNAKLVYTGQGSIPLDFENHTFLAFQSDYCSSVAGTNNILFYVDKAQNIACQIWDPLNSNIVANFSGYVPYATYVDIPWNMTEADGMTPYSNDTYAVSFTAYDPASLVFTNVIDRSLLRLPENCLLSYQWENPYNSDGVSLGPGWILDQHATTAIQGNLMTLFQMLYSWWGLTQFYPGQVGALTIFQRVYPGCFPYTPTTGGWQTELLQQITNAFYSEMTIAQAHGNSVSVGGGHYLTDEFDSFALAIAVASVNSPNWRLRRVAIWACYSGAPTTTAGGVYGTWAEACGIKNRWLQYNSAMYKNCGLFFGGGVPQFFNSTTATADAAEFVDQTWVCGMYQYPGGCDPNWTYSFAVRAAMGLYPTMVGAFPLSYGYDQCVYNAGQDEQLRVGDTSGVHNN